MFLEMLLIAQDVTKCPAFTKSFSQKLVIGNYLESVEFNRSHTCHFSKIRYNNVISLTHRTPGGPFPSGFQTEMFY